MPHCLCPVTIAGHLLCAHILPMVNSAIMNTEGHIITLQSGVFVFFG